MEVLRAQTENWLDTAGFHFSAQFFSPVMKGPAHKPALTTWKFFEIYVIDIFHCLERGLQSARPFQSTAAVEVARNPDNLFISELPESSITFSVAVAKASSPA